MLYKGFCGEGCRMEDFCERDSLWVLLSQRRTHIFTETTRRHKTLLQDAK